MKFDWDPNPLKIANFQIFKKIIRPRDLLQSNRAVTMIIVQHIYLKESGYGYGIIFRWQNVNMTALFDHSQVKQHGDHYSSNLQRGYKNHLQWAANKFDCDHSKSIFETIDGLGVSCEVTDWSCYVDMQMQCIACICNATTQTDQTS